MTRTHVAAVIALLAAALLPASAARADPVTITATCTTSAGTGSCSTDWYTTGVTVSFTLSGTFSNPQGCGDTTINTDTTGTRSHLHRRHRPRHERHPKPRRRHQTRRDAAERGNSSRPQSRLERLVQPPGRDHRLWKRRDLRDCLLHVVQL